MQISRSSPYTLFCLLALLLSSCALNPNNSNSSSTKTYLKKELRFSQDMALVETKAATFVNNNRLWVFSFPQVAYYNNYVDATIPTFAAYHSDTKTWQRWQGSVLTGWSRIKGIINKGTRFEITDITPRDTYHKDYWVTISFTDGPYRGEMALLGNPRNLIPEMYQ